MLYLFGATHPGIFPETSVNLGRLHKPFRRRLSIVLKLMINKIDSGGTGMAVERVEKQCPCLEVEMG